VTRAKRSIRVGASMQTWISICARRMSKKK